MANTLVVRGVEMVDGGSCWRCHAQIMLPRELYDAAHRSSGISIYCPYGHAGVYSEEPTEADRLRKQLEAERGHVAYWREEYASERRQHSATKGKVTRLRKRAEAGMCSSCNRTFQNVAKHMRDKHGVENGGLYQRGDGN